MDYDSIAKAGSMLGSGAVIVMDDIALHGRVAAAPVVLLHARDLRPVHAVPRRHGLALPHGRPHRTTATAGCSDIDLLELGRRQHPGPHHLRARRRRGDAGARDDQALPPRVRRPDREGAAGTPADRPGRASSTARSPRPQTACEPATPRSSDRAMIEIELDGQKVAVPEGSMVMHAADKAGTYIPHFCYHKKLTIAANCRMCLVDDREGAQADAGLRHAGDAGHDRAHQERQGDQGAAGGDGVPADQPPARLPDLRPGRRVPAAGPGGRLRRVVVALRRGKARRVPRRTSAR